MGYTWKSLWIGGVLYESSCWLNSFASWSMWLVSRGSVFLLLLWWDGVIALLWCRTHELWLFKERYASLYELAISCKGLPQCSFNDVLAHLDAEILQGCVWAYADLWQRLCSSVVRSTWQQFIVFFLPSLPFPLYRVAIVGQNILGGQDCVMQRVADRPSCNEGVLWYCNNTLQSLSPSKYLPFHAARRIFLIELTIALAFPLLCG